MKRIKTTKDNCPATEIVITTEEPSKDNNDTGTHRGRDRYREKFFLLFKKNNPLKSTVPERRETEKQIQVKKGDKEFFDLFDIGNVIGEGTTAIVRKIRQKNKEKFYAIKSYKKKTSNFWPSAKYETDILNRLNHRYIVKSVKFFKSTTVRYHID